MVFANGKSSSNWNWSDDKEEENKEEEKEKYPIPKEKGKFYSWRMDMETLVEFGESDFIEALDSIGIFEKNLE